MQKTLRNCGKLLNKLDFSIKNSYIENNLQDIDCVCLFVRASCARKNLFLEKQ